MKGTQLVLTLGAMLASVGFHHARAEDVGVTIQTTLSTAYKGTAPLTASITGKLKGGAEDSHDVAKIAAHLRKLKDGDVLVLAIHSSQRIFAIGGKTHPWSDFWKVFGIAQPPRLSAAILGGCMVEDLDSAKIKPITPDQVRELRGHLNAEIIYTPRGAIPFILALNNTDGILTSLLSNKKLKDIDLDGKWYQNVSTRWTIQSRWSELTLNNLRRVSGTSRAYEAGVDARLKRANPDNTAKKFDADPAYKMGWDHANAATDGARLEEEKARKLIMGEQ